MGRKYIEVHDRNPWGEEVDEELLNDPGKDSTYIEGYSDVRRNRELDVARGKQPRVLKHRLQWVRAKASDGITADGKRMSHWQVKRGYRPLKYDEAIKLGYFVDKNPAITKGATDEFAWKGGDILMIADARTAATNLKRLQRDNHEAETRAQARMEKSVESFNANTKGANATAFSFVGDDPDESAKKKR